MTNSNATIAERIERLPLGRFHRRFIALVSLGNFFDLYDIFIVAYIGAALQQSGFLTLRQFTFFGDVCGDGRVWDGERPDWAAERVHSAAFDLFDVYVCGRVCAVSDVVDSA